MTYSKKNKISTTKKIFLKSNQELMIELDLLVKLSYKQITVACINFEKLNYVSNNNNNKIKETYHAFVFIMLLHQQQKLLFCVVSRLKLDWNNY